MALPQVTLTGNLVEDPELRFTQSGKGVASFRVACNERRKNAAGEWEDGDSCFLSVTCWRNAQSITDALKKGTKVQVTGRLTQQNYETEKGEKRTSYNLVAEDVALVIYGTTSTSVPSASSSTSLPADDPWASESTPF